MSAATAGTGGHSITRMFRPGSFGWLVSYDLVLSWRRFMGMFGSLKPRTVALIVITAIVAFHIIAYPVAQWAADVRSGSGSFRLYYPALASAVLFILPWLISQSLTNTTRALYTRGDLDLMLASPLPAHYVLAARALAIAIEATASVAIFILPVANMNALFGGVHWLAIYPALLASGLFATSLGICIALGLFVVAGPRRTRVFSQILATIIGAFFVLALQAINVLPEEQREAIVASIESSNSGWLFDRHGPLWLPVRAAAGEPLALLAWFAIGVSAFVATAFMLGRKFAVSVVHSAGAPAPVRVRSGRGKGIVFRTGMARAMRLKEWRLLIRDPWLISQIMLQVIYTLPIAIVIWRSQGPDGSIALSVAPAIVVIASQISASLAWLTISGEDAPEFLASAPVTRADIHRRKLEAIALPLACFLALPLAGLAWFSTQAAILTLTFAAGASLSTAFLNLWHPMPARRVMVLRRHSQSKLIAMMEHLLSLLWALALVTSVLGTWIAVFPFAAIALVMWVNRPRKARAAIARPAAQPAPAVA